MQQPGEPGQPDAAEEDAPVPRLDRPRSIRDRLRGVDTAELDLRLLGDQIEQRRPIRSRFGRDDRHAEWSDRLSKVLEPRGRALPPGPRFPSPPGPTGGEPGRIGGPEGKPAARIGAQEHSGRRCTHLRVDAVTALEGAQEGDVRSRRLRIDRSAAASQAPRRFRLRGPELRREACDLPQRNLPLERLLDVASPQGGLPRMDTLQHERLRQIGAVAYFPGRGPRGHSPRSPDRPGRNEGHGRRAARGRRGPSDGRTARRRVRGNAPRYVQPGYGAARRGVPRRRDRGCRRPRHRRQEPTGFSSTCDSSLPGSATSSESRRAT